jgi:hypothetical protein
LPELYKKHPEAPQFDPIAPSHCSGNLNKDRIQKFFCVLTIKVRILNGYPVNQFGFYHDKILGLRGLVENWRLNLAQCPLPAERDRIGVRERNDV